MAPRSPETLPETLAGPVRTFDLYLRSEGKSAKTRRTYCESLVWFAQRHPHDDWTQFTRADVREHIAHVVETHSASYASNQFRAMQQGWRFLADELEIPNIMTGMKPPVIPPKLVPVLEPGELDAMLATCSGKGVENMRDKALILLLHSSGARLGEISGLKIADIALDETTAYVLGKAGKPRFIRFSPACAVAIHRYLRYRNTYFDPSPMLWVGRQGPMTKSGIAQMLDRRGKRAGIHANAHRWRHDFSHRWLAAGGESADLMELNGWSSASMVRRYGQSAASQRARAHYDRVMSKGA